MSADLPVETLGTSGVTKQIIKAAEPGAATVSKGNKVTVNCTGYLATDPPTKFWR